MNFKSLINWFGFPASSAPIPPDSGEERLCEFANSQERVIWFANPGGVAYFFNDFCRKYLGLYRADSDPHAWLHAIHPADRARAEQTWARAVKNQTPYLCEYRFRQHASGAYRSHRASARPVFSAEGRLSRWYGMADDIEQTKLTEKSLSNEEKN